MNDLQKRTCQAIVNVFESGSPTGNYGAVTLLKGDPGHLTYGRSQTTLGSGNLYSLIKAYCEAPDAQFGGALRPYLDRLAAKDLTLDMDATLRATLKEAGNDPVMRREQDAFFDRAYYIPAMNHAQSLGLELPLADGCIRQRDPGWMGTRFSEGDGSLRSTLRDFHGARLDPPLHRRAPRFPAGPQGSPA